MVRALTPSNNLDSGLTSTISHLQHLRRFEHWLQWRLASHGVPTRHGCGRPHSRSALPIQHRGREMQRKQEEGFPRHGCQLRGYLQRGRYDSVRPRWRDAFGCCGLHPLGALQKWNLRRLLRETQHQPCREHSWCEYRRKVLDHPQLLGRLVGRQRLHEARSGMSRYSSNRLSQPHSYRLSMTLTSASISRASTCAV